jgi:ribosome-associated protein
MKYDVPIKNGIVIPEHELEITASRSGGPGGQHVNKTSTRITVRWNVKNTQALTEEQKTRVLEKLASRLTTEGDLIIHNSTSRSQEHNKKMALAQLANDLRKALYVAKTRMKTRVPKGAQEGRLQTKAHRGLIKKRRHEKIQED